MPLIELRESYLELVLKWRNSKFVREGILSSEKISWTEHKSWFDLISNDSSKKWYVHINQSSVADGVVYFTSISPENADAFWGLYKNPR